MMLLHTWAVLVLTTKRLIAHPALTLVSILGMTSAAILVMSIPIYVDAVFNRLLHTELSGPLAQGRCHLAPNGAQSACFRFVFHRVGNQAWPLLWSDIEAADRYLSGSALASLNLAEQKRVRLFKSRHFGLFPSHITDYKSLSARLANVHFGWISDLQQHIEVAEGTFPQNSERPAPFQVLIAEAFATRTGLQVGEVYTAFASEDDQVLQIPVHIAGIWRPKDPQALFWFRNPQSFDDVLFVPQATFAGALQSHTGSSLSEALWYFVLDGTSVRASTIPLLTSRIRRMQNSAASLLPDMFMTSPLDMLFRFQIASRALTIQLFTFAIPILGLNLVFIGLITGMSVQRRWGEIAVMRSRGATRMQIIGIAVFENLTIAASSLVLAIPGSLGAAYVATQIRSFLQFNVSSGLPVSLNSMAIWAGVAVFGFALVTQLLPTVGASRHTAVSVGREQARLLRPPWWQRTGLDLLLLIPAAYGLYMLIQEGNVLSPTGDATAQNPFDNPLLLLIPSLTAAALTLFLIRMFPLALAGLTRLLSLSSNVSFLFAVRHLARTRGLYTTPIALLTVTLSLSVFLSTTAQTLGTHLTDQALYQVGADLVLLPRLDTDDPEDEGSGREGAANQAGEVPDWYYIPLSEYRQVAGIVQAARVGRFPAVIQQAARNQGILLATDSDALAQVAFWKPEFASMSLGALMNELALVHNGVLLPAEFMQQHALAIGDPMVIRTQIYGYSVPLTLQIVGNFDIFPTWNPRWGPMYVINVPYLFQQIGLEVPTAIWLKANPTVNPATVRADLGQLNPYSGIQTPFFTGIALEEQRPERQGLLGLLTIGFVSAILLASVGFVMYIAYSLQQRSIELGILRSVGLSVWQMIRYLAWELSILVIFGLVSGTRLGMLVSQLWIPYFRIGKSDYTELLPVSVQYSWPALWVLYALFSVVFVTTLLLLAARARKLRLFEIVKMGESV